MVCAVLAALALVGVVRGLGGKGGDSLMAVGLACDGGLVGSGLWGSSLIYAPQQPDMHHVIQPWLMRVHRPASCHTIDPTNGLGRNHTHACVRASVGG